MRIIIPYFDSSLRETKTLTAMVATSLSITRKTKTSLHYTASSKRDLSEYKALIADYNNRTKTTYNKDSDEYDLEIYTNVGQAFDLYDMTESDLAHNFYGLPEFEDVSFEEIAEHLYNIR